MPIVAKHIIEARRATAAARTTTNASAQTARASALSRPPENHRSAGAESAPQSKPRKRRGHAVKGENGKWQPTGDYESGFARGPKNGQFQKGCPPGPGRTPGSKSHDTLSRKQLDSKRDVTVGGRRKKVSQREIILMRTYNDAVEGKDKKAREYALKEMDRLYPTQDASESAAAGTSHSASDQLSLAEYEQELRERIRAELAAERNDDAGEER